MENNMKTLVIAEKPSVGRDIARVLRSNQKQNGYIEGPQYIVTWGLGHLITLQDPEDYHKKYQSWKMEDLPIMPEKLELTVIKQTNKQYQTVKTLLHRKDVSSIIIATDAGREGELVARWILKKAHNQKPCKRLWISSVTDKAIKEGFAHLKNAKEYDNLYYAAISRAEADWLVGINATRALTCKYNAQLSCGRVQTPTLAMIAKREEDIKRFKPKPYYALSCKVSNMTFQWRDKKSNNNRLFEKEKMDSLVTSLSGQPLAVTQAEKKKKTRTAPLLYDLTELQRDANKAFGFSAKETLGIMQSLYEGHKVLTYPRTDSRYLTSDIVPTLKERIQACSTGPYRQLAQPLKNQQFKAKPSFVNDSKVSDHHAIIPTEQYVDLLNMSAQERKIYDLVVRRFLAVLYPPCIYEETTVTAAIGKETFVTKGNVILEEGFTVVYNKDENSDQDIESGQQKLPVVKAGDKLAPVQLSVKEDKTKPPARFNEAALLSAMENPIAFMEAKDHEAAVTLGETGGLGTVATRADIIEKLFNSFLMEKRGNDIYLTSKGRQLLELVPQDLRKPEMTADWEMKLSAIAGGKLKSQLFMSDIRRYTGDLLNQIKAEQGTFRHDNMTNKKCPQCGKRLLAVNGKNAKLLVCQDRECGYRETVSRLSNARCPVCHKKMEMIEKGGEPTFVCGCGFKERLSKFQERRKQEGKGVSKRDVASYMKQQKQETEEPVNNVLAEALKGLNL